MGLPLLPADADVAATVARVALGAMFLVHGWPKVKDIRKTMAWVRGTGFPGGAGFAFLVSLLESLGAVALILGILTQVAAVLFALEMVATSIFSKTTLKKKYVLGYELDVLYLVVAVIVALLGPGPWSLDRILELA